MASNCHLLECNKPITNQFVLGKAPGDVSIHPNQNDKWGSKSNFVLERTCMAFDRIVVIGAWLVKSVFALKRLNMHKQKSV